jgi:hypothetical protein
MIIPKEYRPNMIQFTKTQLSAPFRKFCNVFNISGGRTWGGVGGVSPPDGVTAEEGDEEEHSGAP